MIEVLVLFVRLFGLCLFRFVGFLFLLGSGWGLGLWFVIVALPGLFSYLFCPIYNFRTVFIILCKNGLDADSNFTVISIESM